MNAHTPGPWTWHSEGSRDYGTRGISGINGTYVAGVQSTRECWEGDARLIAAAPDLLVALQGIAAQCEESWLLSNDHDTAVINDLRERVLLRPVLEAIEKAMGS